MINLKSIPDDKLNDLCQSWLNMDIQLQQLIYVGALDLSQKQIDDLTKTRESFQPFLDEMKSRAGAVLR